MKLFLIITIFLINSCATTTSRRSQLSNDKNKDLSSQLNAFTSDGCSSWPDGTRENPNAWLKCCYEHDREYWLGGSEEKRESADQDLKSCVKKTFSNFMGILMYMGVRMGGSPSYETSYRWGYGWSYDRGYVSLTEEEYNFAQNLSPYKEYKAK